MDTHETQGLIWIWAHNCHLQCCPIQCCQHQNCNSPFLQRALFVAVQSPCSDVKHPNISLPETMWILSNTTNISPMCSSRCHDCRAFPRPFAYLDNNLCNSDSIFDPTLQCDNLGVKSLMYCGDVELNLLLHFSREEAK